MHPSRHRSWTRCPPDPAVVDTLAAKARVRVRAGLFEGAPRRFGRFEVVGRLGAGAMAVVYAARDPKLRRRIALKVLARRRDGNERARLLREARSLAQLQHPNVVQVYEVLEQDDEIAIAMEFVAGTDLEVLVWHPPVLARCRQGPRAGGPRNRGGARVRDRAS